MPSRKPYPKLTNAPRPSATAHAAVRGPVARLTPVKPKTSKKK